MGRKPKPPVEKQDHVVAVRVTAVQAKLLDAAARRLGLPTATFARTVAITQAEGILATAKKAS
jgi:uncharacterized protein (DUF1778 family)